MRKYDRIKADYVSCVDWEIGNPYTIIRLDFLYK